MLVRALRALVAAGLLHGADADAEDIQISVHEELASMVAGIRSIRGVLHKDAWQDFVVWFDEFLSSELNQTSESAFFPRYSAASFAPATFGEGPGLKTLREKVAPGDPVMVVPCSVMMDMESGFNSGAEPALRSYAEDVDEVDGRLLVAMHLTWEALHLEKSFFKSYIRLLPPVGAGIHPWLDLFRASMALNATDGDSTAHAYAFAAVLHLGGYTLFHMIKEVDRRQKQAADTASRYLLPLLEAELLEARKQRAEDIGGAGSSLHAVVRADLHTLVSAVFSWAWDITMTRSFWSGTFNCPPSKQVKQQLGKIAARLIDPIVLIPLASMMNHDSRLGAEPRAWGTPENKVPRGSLFVNAAQTRSFGDQLFLSYKLHAMTCNIEMLYMFSFALQDSLLDCVKYTLTYPNGTYGKVNMRDNNLILEEALRIFRRSMLAGIAQECEVTVADHWDKPLSLNTEVRALRRLRGAYMVDLMRARRSLELFRDAILPNKGPTKSKTLPVDYASLIGLITPSSQVVQAGLTVARGSLRVLEAAIEAIDQRWLSYLGSADQEGDNGQIQTVFQDDALESRVGVANVKGQQVCSAVDMTRQSIDVREQRATSMAREFVIPAASEATN